MLRRLLAKPSPRRYSLSAPIEMQRGYDFLTVLGATNDHNDAMLVSWEPQDNVSYMWWDEGAVNVAGEDATCIFNEIQWESLSVRHRFITWDIVYDSLLEAYLHDVFRLQRIKWIYQIIRNKSLSPIQPDYRIQLLRLILTKYSESEPITENNLLLEIHGSAIRLSSDYYRHEQDLRFLLQSLSDSGDVLLRNEHNSSGFFRSGNIRPTPKALTTIADFDEDSRRHKDVVTLTRRQLFLGLGMFSLAAVTLFVELFRN